MKSVDTIARVRRAFYVQGWSLTRLGTLRTTQEARIALNEAIDSMVRGEPLTLSPNATQPIARIARELPSRVPEAEAGVVSGERPATGLAEGVPVAAGSSSDGLNALGDTGQGLSLRTPDGQPQTPAAANIAPEAALENRVVEQIARVLDGAEAAPAQIGSPELRQAVARLSELERLHAAGGRAHNTALRWLEEHTPGFGISGTGEARGLSSGYFRQLPTLIAEQRKRVAAIRTELARRPAQPMQAPVAREAPSVERQRAEAAIARAETSAALAEQHGVDLATGDFAELAEIEQLRAMGRLTPEDEAALLDADQDFEIAEAYGNTLKATLACLV